MRHFETNKILNKSVIGRSVKHDSSLLQVTGQALYIDDMAVPENCLHAYPVLSTIAYGKIINIDTSKAKTAQGFKQIVSSADIPGKCDIGPVFPGDVLLADQDIAYHGQPILLVIADSYDHARKAAKLVEIEYETSDAVIDIRDSIAKQDWVRPPYSFGRGDIKKGFKEALHELHGEISIGGQEHFYLEGQIAITMPTEDGGIFVKSSTQNPTEVQHHIAEVLDLPFNKVTIEMRRMGGGFGGKETQAVPWAVLAALATHQTGRAVKLRLCRSDDFKATGKRHPFLNQYHVGFDDNGAVISADITLNGYCGNSPDVSEAIVDRAMLHSDNTYFYENVRITGNRCRTNTVSSTAFRGFGGPQGMIVAEAIMDDIARHLDQDPLEIRRLNLYKPGRDLTPYSQQVEQFVVENMIEQLSTTADYSKRRDAIHKFNAGSPIIKRGLSMTPVKFGISFNVQHLNQAGALVLVYTDGSIHLNHGGTEMGQGLNTKVAQIVAHAFGVSLERVGITATRTDKIPNTSPTAASSGTDLNGMAALNAVTKIKNNLSEFIVTHFKADSTSIQFENDQVMFNTGSISFRELAQLAYMNRVSLSANGFYSTPKIYFDRNKGEGRPFFYFSHGVALAEVEIDRLTGENSVTQVDILFDAGNSLNPALDIGQIEGAFIQGMGWLTTEDLQWNSKGELASFDPATYKIPAIGDTPKSFNVSLYDSENPELTVFRSKAIGEPPFMLANSVWCALRDAVGSITNHRFVPPLNPPATPETILGSVQTAEQWLRDAGE